MARPSHWQHTQPSNLPARQRILQRTPPPSFTSLRETRAEPRPGHSTTTHLHLPSHLLTPHPSHRTAPRTTPSRPSGRPLPRIPPPSHHTAPRRSAARTIPTPFRAKSPCATADYHTPLPSALHRTVSPPAPPPPTTAPSPPRTTPPRPSGRPLPRDPIPDSPTPPTTAHYRPPLLQTAPPPAHRLARAAARHRHCAIASPLVPHRTAPPPAPHDTVTREQPPGSARISLTPHHHPLAQAAAHYQPPLPRTVPLRCPLPAPRPVQPPATAQSRLPSYRSAPHPHPLPRTKPPCACSRPLPPTTHRSPRAAARHRAIAYCTAPHRHPHRTTPSRASSRPPPRNRASRRTTPLRTPIRTLARPSRHRRARTHFTVRTIPPHPPFPYPSAPS
ncbi:hypothetical protein PYCCODRAFT_1467310 [Trametes coccinea BRFM310]|uniref:Uncharacterized protein n=1 Tax=Trametes coccinea (strain BRFM310) TaxID=1353009 RepID=A0A1Y2IST4_TRAC3|nr:hypothetical protein PYCCODRAFT_1467310 [Trametes coccinea BRFM310]